VLKRPNFSNIQALVKNPHIAHCLDRKRERLVTSVILAPAADLKQRPVGAMTWG